MKMISFLVSLPTQPILDHLKKKRLNFMTIIPLLKLAYFGENFLRDPRQQGDAKASFTLGVRKANNVIIIYLLLSNIVRTPV